MLWIILAIVVLLIVILMVYNRYHAKVVAPQANNGLGVQLRKGAEQIPVYGQFVKVAGVVGKPLNNILDKSVSLQVNALKQIPVVGNVAAKPLEYSQQAVKKINNWIGL